MEDMKAADGRDLKPGKVVQVFGDGSISKPYIVKDVCVWDKYSFWGSRVWLYTLEGKINHVAHYSTLKNID